MQKHLYFGQATRLKKVHGFTLIELMVVVAIVGILASVAYPSFMSQVRKSRRSDAVVAIAGIQQAQERWRANNTNYAESITAAATASRPGLGFPSAISEGGYYTLSMSNPTATSYTLTATAVATKGQSNDVGCTPLVITFANGNGSKTPVGCWSN